MKKVLSLVLGVAALAVAVSASADGHKHKATGVNKAYWATSGMFGPFAINGLIPSIPADKVRDVTIPVSMWIIEHDKGLVVFDTGNNIEVTKNCEAYWDKGTCGFLKPNQTAATTIDGWLKKLGYKTEDVKVVVTSHAHLDHAGNLKLFPNAVHAFQKAELYQGWWPEQFQGRTGAPFVKADMEGTRGYNFLELNGDYDLFGDGSVVILSTPGHTLGHQSMQVTMKSGKRILLAQDAIWMQENLDGHPAGLNFSVKTYFESLNRMKFIRDLQGVQLFFGHDENQWAAGGDRWYK
ncbi:MAG: N-acyl homoserine lactonase family protein [Proteobacteria bacterium]|nr:N-acyl homoserine lactonase family protein [Pseudomonadota bacterium]